MKKGENKIGIEITILIASIFVIILILSYITQKEEYDEFAQWSCTTINEQTDIINKESQIIKITTGEELTTMQKLDCEQIQTQFRLYKKTKEE